MVAFSIADRRAVATASMLDPSLAALLLRDPRTAVAQVTGKTPPDDLRITTIEETQAAWEFVLPAGGIDAELPEPNDARGAIENDVYEVLRERPEVKDEALRDPKAFLVKHFEVEIPNSGVNVRQESQDELMLVLPCRDARETLDDAMLDLVAGGESGSGGGDCGCQNGNKNSSRTTPRPW